MKHRKSSLKRRYGRASGDIQVRSDDLAYRGYHLRVQPGGQDVAVYIVKGSFSVLGGRDPNARAAVAEAKGVVDAMLGDR